MVDEAHRTQYQSLASQHAAGPAERLLPRLHRHPDRQEGPEHAADLRLLHRHLYHRTSRPGQGDGADLLREPARGAADHRADHRPGLPTAFFADRTEEERAAIKRRFATEQAIAGAPRRIEAICLDLIDHFNQFIAPNGFKAQVVATSRHAAVSYKDALDRLNGPESALIMSSGHNDEERLGRTGI